MEFFKFLCSHHFPKLPMWCPRVFRRAPHFIPYPKSTTFYPVQAKNSGSQFQEQNFHPTNEKSGHGVKGPSFFFLWVKGMGFFFSKLCLVCRVTVHSSLSTFTVDINCPCKIFFVLNSFGEGLKQRVPNNTSLISHMLWVMLSSFHLYTWAKGEEL